MPPEYHQTKWATDRAINFINQRADRPWLLSINVFDPHPPFDPPQAYLDRYDPDTLPPPLFRLSDIDRQADFGEVSQQATVAIDPNLDVLHLENTSNTATIPPKSFNGRKIKAAYYAMIELIDSELGRLCDH